MLDPSQGFTEAPPDPDIAIPTAPAHLPFIPHSVENEQALLGALLIDPDQMIKVGYLTPPDFYLTYHGYLYEAMAILFEKHSRYDIVTITNYLESVDHLEDIGGAGTLADLINTTPTSFGAAEYAAQIYKDSIRRQQIIVATEIAQAAYGDVSARTPDVMVSEAVSMISSIDATRNVSGGPKMISAGVSSLLDSMEQIEVTGQVAGLQTGIKTLDHIFGGFQKDKYYLLAGRPGMGKSALALQIAMNIAEKGTPVLYFSLEMSEEAMAGRLVSSISGVPYEAFNRPGIGDKWPNILNAGERVARLPVLIDDTPALTISSMRLIAQKLMLTEPVGLLIVDHLGLARPELAMKDSYHEVSQISHSLMSLSKQLNIPILALCQLSRAVESRADKRPMLSDLRDSGKLEQDADGVLFLYRDEVYNPNTEFPHLAEIGAVKNRGGRVGTATVYADMPTNRFVDLETRTVAI